MAKIKKLSILVTGADGFLGSSFIKKYYKEFSLIAIEKDITSLKRIDKKLVNKIFLYSSNDLEKAFINNNIDVILHTATCHTRNLEDINETISTNIILGLKLVQFAKLYNVEAFINIDTVLNKYTDIYSFSKRQFSEWMKWFNTLHVINLEIDMFYGANAGTHNFVYSMICKMLNNENQLALTRGTQNRSILYIDDLIRAIYLIITDKAISKIKYESWKVLNPKKISIKEFLLLIKKLTKSSSELLFDEIPYREDEIMDYEPDLQFIIKYNWMPMNSFSDGIKKTIQSIKNESI